MYTYWTKCWENFCIIRNFTYFSPDATTTLTPTTDTPTTPYSEGKYCNQCSHTHIVTASSWSDECHFFTVSDPGCCNWCRCAWQNIGLDLKNLPFSFASIWKSCEAPLVVEERIVRCRLDLFAIFSLQSPGTRLSTLWEQRIQVRQQQTLFHTVLSILC